MKGDSIEMQLPRGIWLSPMVRGSELAFRMLARRCGNASLCYSPMLRDHDVISVAADPARFLGKDKELKTDKAGRTDAVAETAYLMLRDTHKADTENLVVQLCGSCPSKLSRATTAVMDVYTKNSTVLPYGIDLNLSCPQECALKGGFGAFLVEKDPSAAISCISSMRRAIDSFNAKKDDARRPLLSAKIRLMDSVDDTIDFVRKLKSAGVNYVAIHCRHRTDKHNGDANWEAGGKIVDAFSSELPIILNGGISDVGTACGVLEQTNCHAVMSATGYLANHRNYETAADMGCLGPQHLALEYLDFASQHTPPSYLYTQKHFRWIFRDVLQPADDPSFDQFDYLDWRVKLWSFLVRPYLRSIEQFRLFVALYVQLSGAETDEQVPASIRHLVADVSFGAVKREGQRMRWECGIR